MRLFRLGKGQSMAEFALVLPFFLLLSLGLMQLAIVFMNAAALKYAAFMTARVAAAYEDAEVRENNAGKAFGILKAMIAHSNSADRTPFSGLLDAGLDRALEFALSLLGDGGAGEDALMIEKETFENSGMAAGGDDNEMRFIRVTVTYRMPLKVPVVKTVFGLFQSGIKINAMELLSGRIFTHSGQEWAKYAANRYMPYYTLRAVSIMRVG